MTLADAALIIARFLVVQFLGWCVVQGILTAAQAQDPQFIQATVTIVAAIGGSVGLLAYRLWKSTLRQRIITLLQHDEVKTVHVAPQVAATIQAPGVVATPPAQP